MDFSNLQNMPTDVKATSATHELKQNLKGLEKENQAAVTVRKICIAWAATVKLGAYLRTMLFQLSSKEKSSINAYSQ